MTIADDHRHLAEFAAKRDGRSHDGSRCVLAAHDFQEPHDVCRAEKVGAEHGRRPPRHCPNSVDVEIGGVARENGVFCGEAIKFAKHLLFDIHFLEDGFDDDVGIRHRGQISDALDQLVAPLHLGVAQAAAFDRSAVILGDDVEPAG